MPRLSLLPLLALLACGLYAFPASAQVDEEEYAGPGYYVYTAPGWSVGVSLADNGTLSEAGDPDVDSRNLDWLWLSDDDVLLYPVYQVDGAAVGRDAEHPDGIVMDDAQFDEFYDNMLTTLGEDVTLSVLESDPNHLTSDGRRWQMFHAVEVQGGDTPDDESDDKVLNYYSFFTLDDSVLRLVNFYYEPLSEDDDFLTAIEIMLAIDPDFEGDVYD